MRVVASLVFFMAVLIGAAQVQSPKKGSAERTAIMNALRVPVQADLKQKVQFKVDLLRTQNGWAFMKGVPLKADGGKIDYRHTKYKDAIDNGAFDDWICALLKKKNGKWTVVDFVIGATDVAYDGWDERYGAPKAIFDIPGR